MIHSEEERKRLMAERLKALRESKHLTFEALSELLHGSPSRNTLLSYEKKENATNNNINLQGVKLAELSEFYNVTTDYLLALTDDPDKKPLAVDELKISKEAKDALVATGSFAGETLSTFLESEDFLDLILNLNFLRVEIAHLPSVAELISHYRNSPGELITDPYDKLRLLRLEIDDCIRNYLESEYNYSSSVKELYHNIELALAALEQEDKSNDGIT